MVPNGRYQGLHHNRRLRANRSKRKILLWMIAVIAVLLGIAVVVLVLVSSKSPAQTEKARDIIKKSDEKLESLRPQGAKIDRSVSIVIHDVGYLSSAQYELTKGNICTLIEETRSALYEVRQDYTGIFNLNGVDDYIKYAKVKLALIDVDFEQLKAVDDYLDYLTGAIAGREAGKPLDSQAVTDATNATVEKMKELSSRVEELTAQAEKIKKDRVL